MDAAAVDEQASDVVVAPAVAEPSVAEAPRAEDVPVAEEKAVDIAPGAEEEVAAPAHAEEREAGTGESPVDEGLVAEEEASPSVEERESVPPAVESPLEEETKEVEPAAVDEQASDVVVAPAAAEPSVAEAPRAEDVPVAEEKAVDIAPGAEEEVAAPAHAEEREAGIGESPVDEGLVAEEEASPSVEERESVAPAVESPLEEETKEVEPAAVDEQASDVVVAPAAAEPSVAEAPRAEDVPVAEEKAVDIAPGAEEEVAAPAHAEEREAGTGESPVDEGLVAEEDASPSVEEREFVAPAVESPLEEETKEVEPAAVDEQASDVVVAPAAAEPSVAEAPRAEDVPVAEEKAVDIAPGAEEEVAAPAHAEEREAGIGESPVDEGLVAEEEASPSVEERESVPPAVESPLEEETKEVEPAAVDEQASDVVVAPAVAEPSVAEAPRAEDVPVAEEKAVDIAPGAEEEVAAPAHAEEREAGIGESPVDEGLVAEDQAIDVVDAQIGFYDSAPMGGGLVVDYFGGGGDLWRKNREEVGVDVDLMEPNFGWGFDGGGYGENRDGNVSCSSISPVVVVGGCKKKCEEVSVDVNLLNYTDDEGVIPNPRIVVVEKKVVSHVCRNDGMEASEWELVIPESVKISNKTLNTIRTREDNEEFVHLGKESLIHGTKEKSALGTEWEFVAEELRDIHVKSEGSSVQSSPYERVNESVESSDWEMVPTGTNGHGERSAKHTEMMKELVKIPIVEEDEIVDVPTKGEEFFLDTSAGEIPNSTHGLDQELPHINAVQKKDQETEDATIDARGSKEEFPFEKLQEEHEFAIKSPFNMEYLKKRPLGVATKSLKHGIQEVKMKAHKAILPTWPPSPITREEENNTHVDTHGENATIVGSRHVPLVVDIEITEEPSVATTKENMEVSGEPYTPKNDDSKRETNISGVEEHDSEAFNQYVSKDTQLETNKTKNMVNVLQPLDNGSNTLINNLLLEGGEEIAAAPSA